MKARIILLILLISLFNCKEDTTKTNPLLALLIGGKTSYSPTIYSIEPKRGNPAFIAPGSFGIAATNHDATLVTIKGKNFIPSTNGNTVLFQGVQASVEFATDQELIVKVPNGAMSGALSVSNNGGSCTSADKKSGINCEGQDFFVDCYAPYNGIYGTETSIPTGTNDTLTFTGFSTKAIRSDLLFTNPTTNEISGNTINIVCTSYARVLLFSQSCVPTEHTANGTNMLLNPIISVNSRFYTIQYLITTGKGECTVRVN